MNLVLDWGGVIIDDPADSLIVSVAKQMEIPSSQLKPLLTKYLSEVACGNWSENQMFEIICKDLNIGLQSKPYWYQAVAEVFVFRQQVLDHIQTLKSMGWTISLLSNTEPSAVKYLSKTPLLALLDRIFVSCEMGVAKPEKAIYQQVQSVLNTSPIFFADDKKENLVPAMELGWNCFHVKTEQDIVDWLRALCQMSKPA